MNPENLTLRAIDISVGLEDVRVDDVAPGDFDWLLVLGMAARVATRLRGRGVVSQSHITAVAVACGVRSILVERIIRLLLEVEFLRDLGNKQYSENIRIYESSYAVLGEAAANHFSELEQLTLTIFDRACQSPQRRSHLVTDLNCETDKLDLVLTLGEAGNLLHTSGASNDQGQLIYSPITWVQNPALLNQMIGKFNEDQITHALAVLRNHQGQPVAKFAAEDADGAVLRELARQKILPAPAVLGFGGQHTFLFTPYQGIEKVGLLRKDIYDRAVALLSCVRYGQNFAQITKIKNPHALLGALGDPSRNYSLKPHTEVGLQYASVIAEGICLPPKKTLNGRYIIGLNPTEENLLAIKVALELLGSQGEVIQHRTAAGGDTLASVRSFVQPIKNIRNLRTEKSPFINQDRAMRVVSDMIEKMGQTLSL